MPLAAVQTEHAPMISAIEAPAITAAADGFGAARVADARHYGASQPTSANAPPMTIELTPS